MPQRQGRGYRRRRRCRSPSPTDRESQVFGVNLRMRKNGYKHRTNVYEDTKGLIIRRGQEFDLTVKVNKEFKEGEDDIMLQFETGKEPRQSKGTKFIITPRALDADRASAIIYAVKPKFNGYRIKLRVNLPSDSVIGLFELYVRLRYKEDTGNGKKFIKYKVPQPVIILLNPWCETDTVYLDDDKERTEYVLNDKGLVYVGNSKSVRGRKWNFGQFEKISLDAALYVLYKSGLSPEAFCNPVRLSRALSAAVNSNDDNGILTGNWSGNYDDAIAPTRWTGSVKILEQFMETKRPVKYGQCWVFSGVLTTVSRALGLPTRSVTNFDSAHDCDASMTIDYHFDTIGNSLRGLNDSVWNFHVWNECWMKRPDLPGGNDGWQAFDATPQEQSDGVMQCGPAPVTAIKKGHVHIGSDTKFIFGEVNGDRVTWEVSWGNRKKMTHVDTERVGKYISTKAVGRYARNDITDDYKYDEGSKAERAAVKNTIQHSKRRKALEEFHNLDQAHDVDMAFTGDMAHNADANFVFKVKNTSGEKRTVVARFTLMAKYYTGFEGDEIEEKKKIFYLDPTQEEQFSWTVKAANWLNQIDEDATIGTSVHARVKETSQLFTEQDTFEIEKPEIKLKVDQSNPKAGKPIDVELRFENPLDIPLTSGSFMVECAGFKTEKPIKLDYQISPRAEVCQKIRMTPKMAGDREIMASFHSRQLVNICGDLEVHVDAEA